MLPQAKRTKEMLSANTEAPAIVEELAGGRDFRASVSRETLETLAGDWFQRAVAPLTTLLERNHLVRCCACAQVSPTRNAPVPSWFWLTSAVDIHWSESSQSAWPHLGLCYVSARSPLQFPPASNMRVPANVYMSECPSKMSAATAIPAQTCQQCAPGRRRRMWTRSSCWAAGPACRACRRSCPRRSAADRSTSACLPAARPRCCGRGAVLT